MSRRRSDPRELASVLERLERLRGGPAPGGAQAPPRSASTGASVSARPTGVVGQLAHAWRAHAFDPGRRGLAVLGVLAVAAALGGAWYFVMARPTTVAPAVAREVASAPASGSAGSLSSSGALSGWPTASVSSPPPSTELPIVVDVVGKVIAP